jgi:hypothetical protein
MARDPLIDKEAYASLSVVVVCEFKMLRNGIVGCMNERVPPWFLDSRPL